MEYLSPKLDIIFKKIFSENRDLLQAFVSDLLDIPTDSITEITLSNTELLPDYPEGKLSRLDLNMTVDNRLVNVEIQMNFRRDFRDRALYYWAKLYESGIDKGQTYDQLKQAITVNILDFNMFDDTEDYHTIVVPTATNTGAVFSDKFAMHFFELKKVPEVPVAADRKTIWMQFLNADSEEDFAMLQNTEEPIMTKAVRVVIDMSHDTQVREAARLREKSILDARSEINSAKAEGVELGREQIIQQLLHAGFPEEELQKYLNAMK